MLITENKKTSESDNSKCEAPQEIVFHSEKKITLSCGKSSITLYPNGKIVLKGDYILSDAEGVNRLSGGRIDLN